VAGAYPEGFNPCPNTSKCVDNLSPLLPLSTIVERGKSKIYRIEDP
jgi:hypothetical protein